MCSALVKPKLQAGNRIIEPAFEKAIGAVLPKYKGEFLDYQGFGINKPYTLFFDIVDYYIT